MAKSVPASLMSADISRFAQRAAQVEKAKPVVAYWCYYWIVNQIVPRGLHQTDEECILYTTHLMDKLEQMKAENADNDAMMDDVAGQAYIEQFGLETFQRADNAVRANRASRQTADTFLAAATFLDLLQIWGPLDPEIASQIKYAKFHALRIAKAIKAGEDPNLSNPTTELSPGREMSANHLTQSEVASFNGVSDNNTRLQDLRQPFVEDAPDDHDRVQCSLAQRSSLDECLHPSRASSVQPHAQHSSTVISNSPAPHNNGEDYYTNVAQKVDVSPLESSSADRKVSVGGGYFSHIPGPASDIGGPHRPISPPEDLSSHIMPNPAAHPLSSTASRPQEFRPTDAFQSFPSLSAEHSNASHQPHSDQQFYRPQQPASITQLPIPNHHGGYMRQHPPQSQPSGPLPQTSQSVNVSGDFIAEEEAIMKAQKHARWAISALNFEDTKTAVKELRGALEALGARDTN